MGPGGEAWDGTASASTLSRPTPTRRESSALATAQTALKKMRELCLSLPDTTEGDHFGETAFFVKKKLFASLGDKHGVLEITFGLEPEHAEALVKNDPRFRPYPRDRRGVVVNVADIESWSELAPLLRQSYELRLPTKRNPPPKKAASSRRPGGARGASRAGTRPARGK